MINVSDELVSDPGPNAWDLILAEIDQALALHLAEEAGYRHLLNTCRGDK